jgi:GxxExxY protein
MMAENEITNMVIGCAIKVHKVLGPGLLESAYEACLAFELTRCELYIERQRPIPLAYQEVKLDCGYRADLIVERRVVVEIKAVDTLNEIHFMQALTHIRLLDVRIGLLINFNVPRLTDGLKRIANKY